MWVSKICAQMLGFSRVRVRVKVRVQKKTASPFHSVHFARLRNPVQYCPSGNVVDHIKAVAVRRARLVLRLVTARKFISSWCVTSHSAQLSFLSSAGWKMSIGQGTVAVMCGWQGNRRPGTPPVMRHRFGGIIYLRIQWPKEGRWAPRLHSSKDYDTICLYLYLYWYFSPLVGRR